MQTADVMTRNVMSIRAGTTMADAIRILLAHGFSGVPVVGADNTLVGILTEGDLLRRAELGTEKHRPSWLEFLRGPGRQADEYVRTHSRLVDDLMTRNVVTVEETTPLEDVVKLMEKKHIKRVPVTRGGVLVGIVSRSDLLKVLARTLDRTPDATGTSDEEIRENLLLELDRQGWAPRVGIGITVRAGMVELQGVIYDEREREALCVAARNTAGVKDVKDQLVWVEPATGMVIGAP